MISNHNRRHSLPFTSRMPSDPELVTLTATGDAEAYAELYRRHRPIARLCAYRLAPAGIDAEDLVSDAFVKILAAIHHGCRPDPFRAYLVSTIRHDASSLYRRRDRVQIVSLYGDDDRETRAPIDVLALDTDPSRWCDLEPVRQAFLTLPQRWRTALWLNTIEGRTPVMLASMLSLTPNAVAALTCRARQGLRQAYSNITAIPNHSPPHRPAHSLNYSNRRSQII